MFNLYKEIVSSFKEGEPILLKELKFNGVKNDAIRQQLKKLTDLGKLKRYDDGIYYLGEMVDSNRVIETKYIKRNNNVIGYYSGRNLAIDLGIINESKTLEVITNDFKPIVRDLKLGNEIVKVRHSNLKIDSNNCHVLRFLDMLKRVSFDEYISDDTKLKLKKYIDKYYIKKSDIDKYIGYFPRKTYKNIYILGINDILVKEEI